VILPLEFCIPKPVLSEIVEFNTFNGVKTI